MLRGMVFVDHMNFDIALQNYYKSFGKPTPKLDYNLLFKKIVKEIPDTDFLKTFIFAPEPDSFLMQDQNLSSYYKWIQGLKNAKYIDVIEGRYIARPVSLEKEMDINDHKTYYKVEKGTDINLAVHAISKAYFNSYDVAFIVSADTDYITVYRQLKTIGKITVAVAVKGQELGKIKCEVDNYIILDEKIFDACIRTGIK
ncbi:MAG: hypothetical protein JG769_1921 [Oscillospiraceae bacterium]|jgi:uncharacterized LabA/DUF88 family protein|nr:hypothetical protein [Oscillospiraceae bacterium]